MDITVKIATIDEASSPAAELAVANVVTTEPGGQCTHTDGAIAVCSWYNENIIFKSTRPLKNASPGVSGSNYTFLAAGTYKGEPGRWFSTR